MAAGGGGDGVQNWKWQNPDAHTVTQKEVSLKALRNESNEPNRLFLNVFPHLRCVHSLR